MALTQAAFTDIDAAHAAAVGLVASVASSKGWSDDEANAAYEDLSDAYKAASGSWFSWWLLLGPSTWSWATPSDAEIAAEYWNAAAEAADEWTATGSASLRATFRQAAVTSETEQAEADAAETGTMVIGGASGTAEDAGDFASNLSRAAEGVGNVLIEGTEAAAENPRAAAAAGLALAAGVVALALWLNLK